MKQFNTKKDRGIALIFSLFFLVLLFAIGLALLFRANLNKKTSTALTNSELDLIKVEGAIGIIKNTISYSMKDKTSSSYGATFGSQSSGDSVLQDERILKSSALKSSANAIDSYNDNDSNPAGSSTEATLGGWSHDGVNLGSAAITDTQWLVYNDQGELIEQQNPGNSITNGQNGFRLAYYIIDQTGKINPNTAITPKDKTSGISFEALYQTDSTPYNLTYVFPDTGINSIRSITDIFLHRDLQDLAEFSTLRTANNDDQTARENLYPYGVTVYYPEITKEYGTSQPNGYPNERLNLHSIYDETLYSSGSTDDEKVDKIIESIPFLKNLSQMIEGDAGRADTNFDGFINGSDDEVEKLPLNKKVAANLKDYIDKDLIATTNFEINSDGSVPKWSELPSNGQDIYCGYEGVSLTGISFFMDSNGAKNFSPGRDLQWSLPSWSKWESVNFILPKPIFEVAVDINLNGKSLIKQDVNPSWTPGNKNDDVHPLLVYYQYDATFKVSKLAADGNGAGYDKSQAVLEVQAPGGGTLFDTRNFKSTPMEHVCEIYYWNSFYSHRERLNGSYPGDSSRRGRTWKNVFNSVNNKNNFITQRGYYYSNTFSGGINNNIANNMKAGTAEGTSISNIRDYYTAMFDPDVDLGTSHGNNRANYVAHNIKLIFEKPVILFFDINGNRMPDQEEIVDIVQLPKETKMTVADAKSGTDIDAGGTSVNHSYVWNGIDSDGDLEREVTTGHDTDKGILRFHPTGDPRNNTHSNSWTQYYVDDVTTPNKRDYQWESHSLDFHSGIRSKAHFPERATPYEAHALTYRVQQMYRSWSYQDIFDVTPALRGEVVPNPSLSSLLTEEDLSLTYSNEKFDAVDHEPYYDVETSTYKAIDDPLKISTMAHPFNADTGKFGGIRSLTELGRISRGEDWRTVNLAFHQLPTQTISSLENKYTDFENPTYTPQYLDADQGATTLKDETNVKFTGGDARLLNEVYIEASQGEIPGINYAVNTRQEMTIHSPVNPNSKNTRALESLLSNIKLPYTLNATTNVGDVSLDKYFNIQETNATKKTQVSSFVDDIENKATNSDKLNQFITNWKAQISNATTAPFPRKYTYSHDNSADERFNPTDIRRLISARLGQAFSYSNPSDIKAPFANPTEFSPLNDVERESLYLESKKFMSIRYHHFSAIMTYEPLQFLPTSIAKSSRVIDIANGFHARVGAHIKIRAELVHDLYTNKTSLIDYKVIN